MHDYLHALNNSPSGWKEQGSKNHWCIATAQSQTKLTHKFSLLHRDQSGKDGLKCPLLLQSMCISLLIKKGITNYDLSLFPRTDNSKFPSGWCLGSFVTGLSYLWCLIISGGVSYTTGSHSSLPLTVRLLTASRREKNKIKTYSAKANDDNWKKPTLKTRKGRVIWDAGCLWESLISGDLTGWLEGREMQEDTYKRNTGRIKWERFFMKR